MKLTKLSPEQKVKMLAELDGYEVVQSQNSHNTFALYKGDERVAPWSDSFDEAIDFSPHYLTSYNAIIPLIQTFPHKLQLKVRDICGNPLICKPHFNEKPITPSQLCDAVLIATGKATP